MPEPMEPEARQGFLRMAEEHPEMTCAETPVEILRGRGWAHTLHGRVFRRWSCQLAGLQARTEDFSAPEPHGPRYIGPLEPGWPDRILGQTNPDADKPFFSDEGLYW